MLRLAVRDMWENATSAMPLPRKLWLTPVRKVRGLRAPGLVIEDFGSGEYGDWDR
jgi:hypothetical protein